MPRFVAHETEALLFRGPRTNALEPYFSYNVEIGAKTNTLNCKQRILIPDYLNVRKIIWVLSQINSSVFFMQAQSDDCANRRLEIFIMYFKYGRETLFLINCPWKILPLRKNIHKIF